MTEKQWLACADPEAMLKFLRGKASERKLRLFACACCERAQHLFDNPRCHSALATVRRAADGLADAAELVRHGDEAQAVVAVEGRKAIVAAFGEEGWGRFEQERRLARTGPDPVADAAESTPVVQAAWAVADAARPVGGSYGPNVSRRVAEAIAWGEARAWPNGAAGLGTRRAAWELALAAELAAHCNLLRDLFGGPFSPTVLAPAWRTPQARSVARAAYERRLFGNLPVLADALEEAGCTEEIILTHLRSPGPHVRGCWALDLVLSRR